MPFPVRDLLKFSGRVGAALVIAPEEENGNGGTLIQ